MHGAGGGTTSTTKVFGNIFISFIGAGVLGLPYAFKEAGILEGICIMTLVGYLSVRAMLLLIDCKDHMESRKTKSRIIRKNYQDSQQSESLLSNGGNSNAIEMERLKEGTHQKEKVEHQIGYGDVGDYAFGKAGSTLVDCAIVVSQIGFCCAYLIFITENTAQYLQSLNYNEPTDGEVPTTEPGSNTQRLILFSIMFPLCFLCFLRQLHKLALFSIFADFANVFAYSIVFWFDFEHSNKVSINPKEFDLAGFPFFAGIAVYCYEGAGMILSLEGSMAVEVRSGFRKIFKFSMFCITTLYIVFGVCGYLSFGPETNAIITLNLPQGLFPLMVKMCLCFSLFFTYPVMMFPVVQIIEKRMKRDRKKSVSALTDTKGNLIRAGMVMVTGLVVLIIPSFSTLMSLVGATCCSLLAFIMPALFHLRIFKKDITTSQRSLDFLLIFVGIFATIIGTVDSLKRLGIIPEYLDITIDSLNATTAASPITDGT